MGIQIAKALGCSVTTTCSSANVGLCTSLGIDQVIDHKTQTVVETLAEGDQEYDLLIDNVGNFELLWPSAQVHKARCCLCACWSRAEIRTVPRSNPWLAAGLLGWYAKEAGDGAGESRACRVEQNGRMVE